MKRYLRGTLKNIELIATNIRETVMSTIGYLLGGTMSIVIGQIVGMIQNERIKKDERDR